MDGGKEVILSDTPVNEYISKLEGCGLVTYLDTFSADVAMDRLIDFSRVEAWTHRH